MSSMGDSVSVDDGFDVISMTSSTNTIGDPEMRKKVLEHDTVIRDLIRNLDERNAKIQELTDNARILQEDHAAHERRFEILEGHFNTQKELFEEELRIQRERADEEQENRKIAERNAENMKKQMEELKLKLEILQPETFRNLEEELRSLNPERVEAAKTRIDNVFQEYPELTKEWLQKLFQNPEAAIQSFTEKELQAAIDTAKNHPNFAKFCQKAGEDVPQSGSTAWKVAKVVGAIVVGVAIFGAAGVFGGPWAVAILGGILGGVYAAS